MREGRKPDNNKGRRFCKLVAEEYLPGSKWRCRCDCGRSTIVDTSNLVGGHTKSCGCIPGGKTIHGHARLGKISSTWRTWQSMIRRCNNPKRKDFHLYGGRGISVCDRWQRFENFLHDMGEKPLGKSLGRVDNSGNYEPSNCRWETLIQQGSNKRNNHLITIGSETKTVSEWSRIVGINADLIFVRIRRGWNDVEAVTTPVMR